MKKTGLLVLGIWSSLSLFAQKNDCIKDFDWLVQKIRGDYPGYKDKVTATTEKELKVLEQNLRGKISRHPDSCGKYLSSYTSWFEDNHLRLSGKWKHNTTASGIPDKPKSEYITLKEDSISALSKRTKNIEGIWVSFRGKMAIVKQPGEEKYYAVAIKYEGYERDQVMYTFYPAKENEFDMLSIPANKDYRSKNGKASLKLSAKILEIHGETRFVRQSGSELFDNAFLYSYQPEFPNGTNTYPVALSLTDSTFYLRIPSFMDDNAEVLVKKHRSEILSRPILIIDIRNNGGGQDNFFQVLSELVYSNPYEAKGVDWYASQGNIKIFEDALQNNEIEGGQKGIDWTNALLREMKKNVGGFVTHPLMGRDSLVAEDCVYACPKRVGIIMNDANASSAEEFILSAKASRKVLLFGNKNTAGVLDYSNAISVPFPSGNYELIYPMTRSRRLPSKPIDNIGIAPDIYIPFPETEQLFDRLDQWVYFVKDYLESMNQDNKSR